jgi:hypothetical protein
MGWSPTHEPVVALNCWPTIGLPEIVGGVVLAGCPPLVATTAVGFESALALPSALLAVTRNRSVDPRSAETAVYFVCVAPEIDEQFAAFASQRSQESA